MAVIPQTSANLTSPSSVLISIAHYFLYLPSQQDRSVKYLFNTVTPM